MSDYDESALLTVPEAIRILDQTPVFPREVNVALEESAGLRLARDLTADRDFPPFRKSVMDGYAIRSADVAGGRAALRVVGQIAAGQWPQRAIAPGETMAIMTGAPLPDGADGVVPVEDVEARVPIGAMVQVLHASGPQRFVAAQGSDCPAGKVVLERGVLIGPAQIAVAASIGAAILPCVARPRVAILGTGDELVDADKIPGPSQIRDSNTPMLAALLRKLGCDVVQTSHVPDDPDLIRQAIRKGMTHDVLFIAGGMSMGEFDYVPRLLVELGVNLKITKLRIKPGKPFVFGIGEGSGFEVQGSGKKRGAGIRDQGSVEDNPPPSSLNPEPRTLNPPASFLFGLPGNPVSAYVCTLRFASRLLTRIAGGTVQERWITGQLAADLPANGPREFYQPALWHDLPSPTITPLTWKGSADLFTLARANALIVRSENEPAIAKGTHIRVLEM